MASTLPHNILSYIATHVEKEDRPHCALICKHWTEPFLNAYWGILEIYRYGTDMTASDFSKSLLINAHRVWAAKFCQIRLNDYGRLLEFQRSSPGMRYFEFRGSVSRIYSALATLDWSLWRSLSYLHISFIHDSERLSFQSLFTNLSVLPCLIHLTLDLQYDWAKRPPISWNDFESLHYHLPRLEYLMQDFHFEPITRDEIESIKAVEPAQTMTRIRFDKTFSTHWLFYFASKYPNLRHFNIKKIDDPYFHASIKYSDQQYQPDLQLFSTLDQFFPCLKTADTWLEDGNLYLLFIFFETLGHFGTKIEHVKLRYMNPIENDTVNKCLQPISESLKFLVIQLRTDGVIRSVAFPRLVTLSLRGSVESIFEVDTILDCFPALRSLSVNEVKISLSTNTHTHTPHPLQKLKIEDSKINNDALCYLSLCCNQLKHVTFINIHYNGMDKYYYEDEGYDEPGQVIFDMSMTNLDTFIFVSTTPPIYRLRDFPKHYMIEQLENDNNGLQTTQQSPRINWYHTYCDRTNRKKKVLEWELGRRDIEFCQRYLRDFDRRRKRGKERKDIQDDRLGFVQKRFWKNDLRYGVYVFRFKSVKNHIFRINMSNYRMR